jgi:hypothetical protein
VERNPKVSLARLGFNLNKALHDRFLSNFSIALIIIFIYTVLSPRGMFFWEKSKFIESITLERVAQLSGASFQRGRIFQSKRRVVRLARRNSFRVAEYCQNKAGMSAPSPGNWKILYS